MDRKQQLEKEINVQKVIQSELSQLKNSAKVYHKEQSCDIFFLSSLEQEKKRSNKILDNLLKEHTSMVESEKSNSGKT
ncbi:hypothetical protein BsWGS_00783 [Bradybaena similaris]